jgi:acetyl esterase/lipase
MRSESIHRAFVARLSEEADTPAVLTFYRLAPEHPFPAALDDCVAAYQHLLASGTEAEDVVFGGDSAGGCLVLATLIALRDGGEPLPAGAFMLSPITDLRNHRDGSRTFNRHSDSMLTMDSAETLHAHYVGQSEAALSNPLVSPMLGDLGGLPPLLFHASSSEILLDDSVVAARRAREAGVDCELEIFKGVPHVWHAIPLMPESKRALNGLGEFIRRATSGARARKREEQPCTTPT